MLYEMQECSNLQLKMRVFLRWLNQRINRCIILEHPPIYYPSVETPSHLISIKCWDPLYGCTPSYILDSHCQIQIPIVLCTSIILSQVPIKLTSCNWYPADVYSKYSILQNLVLIQIADIQAKMSPLHQHNGQTYY